MQDFFISNNEIIQPVNHSKDKKLRTAENKPSYFLKRTICSLIFPISLIFNSTLAICFITKQWKISYIIPIYKK